MNKTRGVISIIFAYIIWGLLPVYWKLLQAVAPDRILAFRILSSFGFLVLLLMLTRQLPSLFMILRRPRQLLMLGLASVILTINWLTYIYSVNSEQIIAGSLGYYINPLVSIALGAVIFKEKFRAIEILAIILAFAGVVVITLSVGSLPWISLILATSFGLYGLLKKLMPQDSAVGLTIETGFVSPLALIYLLLTPASGLLFSQDATSFSPASTVYPEAGSFLLLLLIPLSGIATSLPLILFATGTRHLDLSMVGFFQYIAPTIMLFLGVFAYGEAFSKAHAVCFGLIWTGLLLYTISKLGKHRRLRQNTFPDSKAEPEL